ncbi:MAG: FliH/SctL family protein [Desulfosporosinus sp.]
MKSFIRGRVVKSCNVEVSTPRMVENNEGFQNLGTCLAVLSVGVEGPNAASPELPGWADITFETEAKEKAAMILAEANEKVAMILAEADISAQEIRAQARAEADRLRQEVAETTRAEVYPKAQAEGYLAGRQAGEAEGKRAFQDAKQLFQLAQRAVQEEYAKVDKDLLHLAIKIAERLVRSSLAIEPRRLVVVIQALTLLPQERLGWRLHVAPDDALWLEENQPPCPCPWVTDESLSSGDCFLECQEGVFDARIEAQLDKLEHTLREELQHGGVEPIDADSGSD